MRSKVSVAGALPPSKLTTRPSGFASTLVTLALRKMFSYCLAIRLCSGVTMSLSAPGMIWSISSTMVTFAPSSW